MWIDDRETVGAFLGVEKTTGLLRIAGAAQQDCTR